MKSVFCEISFKIIQKRKPGAIYQKVYSYHSCTAVVLIKTPDGDTVPVQRSDNYVHGCLLS